MNSSSKLQPIAKIRKQQEHNAGRKHGETIRQAQREQQQLDELIGYRHQYSKVFKSASESGLSAVRLQEYMLFISRLDEAISLQQQTVNNGKSRCELSQKEWLRKRGKSKMIDKVVESRQQTEQQAKEKRLQKELEDRPHNRSGNR